MSVRPDPQPYFIAAAQGAALGAALALTACQGKAHSSAGAGTAVASPAAAESFLAANAKRRRSQVAASVCRPLATAAIIHIARQPRTDTRHGGRSHVCVSGAATTRRKHFKAAAALGPKRAAAALQFELLVGPHMGEGVALAAACVITAALLASLSRWVRDSCLRSSRKTIDAALVQGARCPRPPPRPTSRSPAL